MSFIEHLTKMKLTNELSSSYVVHYCEECAGTHKSDSYFIQWVVRRVVSGPDQELVRIYYL